MFYYWETLRDNGQSMPESWLPSLRKSDAPSAVVWRPKVAFAMMGWHGMTYINLNLCEQAIAFLGPDEKWARNQRWWELHRTHGVVMYFQIVLLHPISSYHFHWFPMWQPQVHSNMFKPLLRKLNTAREAQSESPRLARPSRVNVLKALMRSSERHATKSPGHSRTTWLAW